MLQTSKQTMSGAICSRMIPHAVRRRVSAFWQARRLEFASKLAGGMVNRGPVLVAAALLIICIWRIGVPSAMAQGTLVFRNYWYNEQRPVFLADGVTRAAGSNYVVELWAANYFPTSGTPRMDRLATTILRDGLAAGLFDGGYLVVPVVGCGGTAFLSIKIWDKRTGLDFETATTKSSVSFDNVLGDPCHLTVAEPLRGFLSLCLGNPSCRTNPPTLEFASWFGVPFYTAARSSGFGTVPVRRLGELAWTNTVDYSTYDMTATNGQEYLEQSGTLMFLPGEALGSFTVPVLTNGLNGEVVTVGLRLTNANVNAALGVTTGTLQLHDDRPTIRWFDYGGSRQIEIRSYFGWFRLEHTATLSPPQWSDAPYSMSGGCECDGQIVQTFIYNAWPEGFYRAAP